MQDQIESIVSEAAMKGVKELHDALLALNTEAERLCGNLYRIAALQDKIRGNSDDYVKEMD